MASYHLCVKTVKRSAGRSATAAAAYRAGERLICEREGRVHDYTRKQGIGEVFIVAPANAPDWASDRSALWNGAEVAERRRNSVTAREWELALPAEVSDADRVELVRGFAEALVARYGVVADVAVHAPHREGDQRNHHAHILTTTREMGPEGLGAKTRILDAAKTGGVEIEEMRGLWAQMQNRVLERAGQEERVDHRSLEDQRAAALERGDDLAAVVLDRDPEIKLGPAANMMERRAMRAADQAGAVYEPVTERGAQVYAIRQRRDMLAELRLRMERAREVYKKAREQEASRTRAAVEAAKSLFGSSASAEFAEGFQQEWQRQEDQRQREIDEALEAERLEQLEAERQAFIEEVAQAWEASRQLEDADLAKERQGVLVQEVEDIAARHGVAFGDLAAPINARANQIRDDRLEVERQRQMELEQKREREAVARSRDDGMDYGL